jgi:hypothetical protein
VPIFGVGRKKPSDPGSPATPPKQAPVAPAPPARALGLPEPRIAPGYGDPGLVRLLEVARSRDWPGLRAGLAAFTGDDLSSLVGNVCAQTSDMGRWLPERLADESGDGLAMAVLGAHTIEAAWQVRTGKRAQHVSQEQFARFHEILRDAEEYLYTSVELDPASAAPWYSLMTSGRGLQVGLDVVRRRFEAAERRCPGHLGAHRQMLAFLQPKWFGTWELMHEFVSDALRGPHGDRLGELATIAHLARWQDVNGGTAGKEYLSQSHVRSELLEAARRTVFTPGMVSARRAYITPNSFAMALNLAGLHVEARAAFELTEGVVTTHPWSMLKGEPLDAYTKRREISFANS